MDNEEENEVIKKKLTDLSENIRKNLLSAATNVTRKFVIEEHDFLSIVLLAIQHLHKQTNPHREQGKEKEFESKAAESTENKNNDIKEGAGDVNKSNDLAKMDIEKLRKECLKILGSKSFNDEAKSYLLTDCFHRHKLQSTLMKEREIMADYETTHPNVLKGGSGIQTVNSIDTDPSSVVTVKEPTSEKEKTGQKHKLERVLSTDKSEPNTSHVSMSKNAPKNASTIWIQDAVNVVLTYMKNKVNTIFLDNLRNHASVIQKFVENRGTFDKEINGICIPRNRFYLKKRLVYFPLKDNKHSPPSFDLANLLACISFSRSKLFKFLQYRYETVKPFTKTEKHCLAIFLKNCPVSKKRIPCKFIRRLIN